MINADKQLIDLLSRNRKGLQTGIYSVCSAHPAVLQASMLQALTDDSILLVESTSNQVDQYGGYTGMVPQAFAAYVHEAAEKAGFPTDRIFWAVTTSAPMHGRRNRLIRPWKRQQFW